MLSFYRCSAVTLCWTSALPSVSRNNDQLDGMIPVRSDVNILAIGYRELGLEIDWDLEIPRI